LIGRFAALLDSPTNASEFQRADCAPRSTFGNGAITVSDWVQAGRYAASLDPLTPAAGPDSEGPMLHSLVFGSANGPSPRPATVSREVEVANATIAPGHPGSISIKLQSLGDENALGFSLWFDPTNFSYSSVSLGSAATGASLNVNTNGLASGRLACVLALPTGAAFPAGLDEILKLSLQPSMTATGSYAVSLTDQPVRREVSDAKANTLPATYMNGTITLNPAPPLRIAQTKTSVTLGWPQWATGYTLQESAGGLPPVGAWSNISTIPTPTNGESVITLPLGVGPNFYRLYKQ